MLSVGPGHIKLPPGLELNNRPNNSCIICTARRPTKLCQPGPQAANNPNDRCYTIYMTKTMADPSLDPYANTGNLSLEPIFLEAMACALRWVTT